jgi:hypothetical protein
MARTYRTSGVNTDGTSVLAATPKKKSKSKKLWTAIGIGALAIGGLAAYGGWGNAASASGGGFFSSIKTGWGNIFGGATAASVGTPAVNPAISRGSLSTALTAQNTTSLATTGASAAASGGGLKGFFSGLSNMSSGSAYLWGSALQTVGSLLDSSDEDMLAFNTAQHEDQMDYRYAALEEQKRAAEAALAAEIEAAKAAQESRNREGAMASTFMGHTSPIMGSAEGVSGITPGYTPKTPKNYKEFHPVGGLLSAGSIA